MCQSVNKNCVVVSNVNCSVVFILCSKADIEVLGLGDPKLQYVIFLSFILNNNVDCKLIITDILFIFRF